MADTPTTYIGSYRIEQELGTGGFGVVLKAYQPFLDRYVAIKTLHTDVTVKPTVEQQFMHEARTIARLRHRGIVSVYEFGTLPAEPRPQTYMVMEYLSGETLDEHLRRQKPSLSETVSIIEALAEALDYAHAHNVIHRDLKPANVLFTETGEPVIVDFGLAKLIEIGGGGSESKNVNESGVRGTPAYMAPEQLLGESASASSDQYALALIAYSMICGQNPHDTSDISRLIAERLQKPVSPISNRIPALPPAVDTVFAKGLAIAPDQRYASAGDFAAALGDALLPKRKSGKVITVVDPLQAALIESTRRMMRSFLLVMASVIFISLIYCLSVFLRGYQVGKPTYFVWDGILASSAKADDGSRSVTGVWFGSTAERAGIHNNDVIVGDLTLDKGQVVSGFSVNGVPREQLPATWEQSAGDTITRTVKRGDQTFTASYVLEPSSYYLFQMLVYFIPAITGFVCALLLLRRWGAEPGLQLFFPLLLTASFFMISRLVGAALIPNIDGVVAHLLLAALIHFMLVFPTTLPFVSRHPRLPWLLYVPAIAAMLEFLLAADLPTVAGLTITTLNYILYALGILVVLIFKWLRKDVRRYPSLWWYIVAFSMVIELTLVDNLFFSRSYGLGRMVFGTDSWVTLLNPVHIALAVAIAMVLASIGYHKVQLTMGQTLSYAEMSRDRDTLLLTTESA